MMLVPLAGRWCYPISLLRPILRGMRLLVIAIAVLLVAACDRATGPQAFTLGPGCSWAIPVEMATLHVHYADCTGHNVDSLTALGWTITWDTTWVHAR